MLNFLDGVLASRRFSASRFGVLKSVIRSNCVQLVVQAVGQHRRYFSRRYLRTVEPYSLTRFSYLRWKRTSLLERHRGLDDRLSRESALGSIFETMG